MAFLNSWALAIGAVALGVPVLVHWLTRPRPRRLPLSTLRFVREAVRQRRAVHRLRDIVILSLRVLAVAMLAAAFSRPLIGGRQGADAEEPGQAARVVILDVSQSMAAAHGGIEAFERARPVAAEHLTGRARLKANLILAGAQPQRVFESLSGNFADLRRELARAEPRPEQCEAQKALVAAADILGRSAGGPEQRRELIVVSDLQQSNWQHADFSVLPEDTVIRVESVAAEKTPPNLAILRAGIAHRAEFSRPGRLEVEVGNYSETPREVTVDVLLAETSHRLVGLCPAGGSVVLSGETTLQTAGWQTGEAMLVGVEDAVQADNSRVFVVEVCPRPTYGLVTREEPDRRPSSSYYLERALAPQPWRRAEPGRQVVRVPPSQVNREMLALADLLVVNRPGKLAPDAIRLLAALVGRGKPLIYVASEMIDATNLKLLVEAAGADIRMPVEFAPPPTRRTARGLSLAGFERGAPPFSVFGSQVGALIEPLRFARCLDSRWVEGGLRDDVLASYSDGTAGLVWTGCGAGAVVVLNADLAESNLARSPAFVPLLGEITGNLLDRRKWVHATHCGESITAWLPPDAGTAASLSISGPAGFNGELGRLVDEPAGVAWEWPSAGPPGIYTVQREGKPVLAVATGVPAEESDLRPVPASEFQDRLAGKRTIHYRSAISGSRDSDELWTWIGVVCVSVMLLELIALKVFRN